MTTNQQRFFDLLEKFPRLQGFWDKESLSLDTATVYGTLSVLSTSEGHMARFLVGVWLGDNDFHFDYFAARNKLDGEYLDVFLEWNKDPFYP